MDAASLQCIICPKQPHFSDVSHLLTHVASKAHLANYFKIQVRSHQEIKARDLLAQYGAWYNLNNLAKLLSDRLAAKETRKRGSVVKSEAQEEAFTGPFESPDLSLNAEAPQSNSTAPYSLGDVLDPRLYQHDYLSVQDTSPSFMNKPVGTPVGSKSNSQSLFMPQHPPCSTTRPASDPVKAEPEDEPEHGAQSLLQNTPAFSNPSIAEFLPKTPQRAIHSYISIRDRQSGGGNVSGESEDKEKAERLKGVFWPGMNLFDSATEQMRRQRNQKKDDSVLKMMEKTSEGIEPTEMVFSPTGILRKERVITGQVDDDSPLKGETPVPKRRSIPSKRVPLSQSDPKIVFQTGQDNKRPRKTRQQSGQLLEDQLRPALPSVNSPSPSRFFDFGVDYGNSMFDDEFQLSLEGMTQKHHSSFEVFKDENEPKSSTDILQAEHLAISAHTYSHPSLHINNDDNVARKARPMDEYFNHQENIESILPRQGCIDDAHVNPASLWGSPARDKDKSFPSSFPFGENKTSDIDPFVGGGNVFGIKRNPLAAASRHYLQHHRNQSYGLGTRDNYDPNKIHMFSSDGTLSDLGREDRARLCYDGGIA